MSVRAHRPTPLGQCRGLTAPCLAALLLLVVVGCASKRGGAGASAGEDAEEDADAPDAEPWLKRRLLPTVLSTRGAAPTSPGELSLAPGMERVRYPSSTREGELSLLAVVAAPRRAPETADTVAARLPAILLLHSGYALDAEHLGWAQPFVDAGFLVMLPTWRGENGNPGSFELLAGEVDDARAAGRWLASEPDVDVDRLYLFGHGTGGSLAALLALDPDLPFRKIGAASAVTTATTFLAWQREDPARVPFDPRNPLEQRRRALLPNAHELAQPLILYAGEDDALGLRDARRVQERAPDRVELVPVPGDATTAASAALQRFLTIVLADAGATPVAATWRPAASSRSAP